VKTAAIIQARMASTRLPGKVMADLAGKTLLERVVERARLAASLDFVLVATSNLSSDDSLASHCVACGIPCFRGSHDDVLDRYHWAAHEIGAEIIVRLTADCPLLDPAVIDRVVETFQSGDFDYVANTLQPTYPDGLDTEVFGFPALERAWKEARLPSEREHVTPYIWKQPTLFKLGSVKQTVDLSMLRWTVDEPQDLEFVRRIYAELGPGRFQMADILALLRAAPCLAEGNRGFVRNEGYQKSLREDGAVMKGKQP
jgi:spore coat polysaccharide biosynthesis protein SpsF